jgi:hypothetical protein
LGPKTKIEISLTLIIVLLLGCASQQTADKQISGSNRISNLTIKIEPKAIILKIEGNLALTYTAEKQVLPMGVVLQFPDTQLELARRIYVPPENEIISSIKADEKISAKKTTARIFIALKMDTPYVQSADVNRLTVVFPQKGVALKDVAPQTAPVEKTPTPGQKPGSRQQPEPEVIPKSRSAANYLKKVTAKSLDNNMAIDVQADGAITDYKSFILYRPPRIVFDLYNLKSPYKKEQKMAVASRWVKRIRHFGYPDKVRLVLETHQDYLSKYSAVPNDTGLSIQVGNASVVPKKTRRPKSDATSETQQIKLAWIEVPGADSYNVYWRASPGVTRHNGNKIANVQIPTTIKNLKSGVTYYFVVTTVKGSRESPESEEFSFTPGK